MQRARGENRLGTPVDSPQAAKPWLPELVKGNKGVSPASGVPTPPQKASQGNLRKQNPAAAGLSRRSQPGQQGQKGFIAARPPRAECGPCARAAGPTPHRHPGMTKAPKRCQPAPGAGLLSATRARNGPVPGRRNGSVN